MVQKKRYGLLKDINLSNQILITWGKDFDINKSDGTETYYLALAYTNSYSIATNLGYNSNGTWYTKNYPHAFTLSSFTVTHTVTDTLLSWITVGY